MMRLSAALTRRAIGGVTAADGVGEASRAVVGETVARTGDGMATRVAEALLCAGLAGITFAGLTSSSQTSIVDFLCVRIMRVLCKKPKHLLTFALTSCCCIASAFQCDCALLHVRIARRSMRIVH
jgi:hypothetical protein